MVLGHEIVGEVVALGKSVKQFVKGDRVVVPHHAPCGSCHLCLNGNETMCETFRDNLMEPGGFADHVLIRNRATALATHKVPNGVSDAAAVFMEPAVRPQECKTIDLSPDGTAAIMGGGSMGLLHLWLSRRLAPTLGWCLLTQSQVVASWLQNWAQTRQPRQAPMP